jgi:hypothetical protein
MGDLARISDAVEELEVIENKRRASGAAASVMR